MKLFEAALFVNLANLSGVLRSNRNLIPSNDMTEEAKISCSKVFDDCEKDCVELELVASVATIKKLRRQLAQPNCTWGEYGALAEELHPLLFNSDVLSNPSLFSIEKGLWRTHG
jgi:hypothetical protein